MSQFFLCACHRCVVFYNIFNRDFKKKNLSLMYHSKDQTGSSMPKTVNYTALFCKWCLYLHCSLISSVFQQRGRIPFWKIWNLRYPHARAIQMTRPIEAIIITSRWNRAKNVAKCQPVIYLQFTIWQIFQLLFIAGWQLTAFVHHSEINIWYCPYGKTLEQH